MSEIIDVTDDAELAKIKADVDLAHDMINKHFRMDLINETRFVDENFNMIPNHASVDFLAPDTANITPLVFGQEMALSIVYRLQWEKDDGLAWYAKNPLTGSPLGYLVVRKSAITEKKEAYFIERARAIKNMPRLTPNQAYRLGSMFRKH